MVALSLPTAAVLGVVTAVSVNCSTWRCIFSQTERILRSRMVLPSGPGVLAAGSSNRGELDLNEAQGRTRLVQTLASIDFHLVRSMCRSASLKGLGWNDIRGPTPNVDGGLQGTDEDEEEKGAEEEEEGGGEAVIQVVLNAS